MAAQPRSLKGQKTIPRKHRRAGQPFGRSPLGTPSGDLTDFGCPDCRGVLAVREEGSKGHLAFACRVGHAFSGESLVRCKEEQLENTLWEAVEVYEEIVLLHRELAGRSRGANVRGVGQAYERRAKRALALVADLRDIIYRDSPANAERVKE
jgi:two-component system chemotaxis response regulator CheB